MVMINGNNKNTATRHNGDDTTYTNTPANNVNDDTTSNDNSYDNDCSINWMQICNIWISQNKCAKSVGIDIIFDLNKFI